MKNFQYKLFQSHWQRSHTETFNIEAETEEEAKKAVDQMITDKGIEKDFDVELVPEVSTEIIPTEEATDTELVTGESTPES